MSIIRLLITVVAVALLWGCGANNNSIFRTTDADDNDIILVDAKQRGILTQTVRMREDDGFRQQRIIACAEPSPDVFSVLSAALTTSATIDLSSGDSAAGELATAISEAGGSIGLRTQTIQVLRDMMFRLCERYYNNAITGDEFEQQAARDQRLIASVLAIEQLTGAVVPAPVTVFAAAEVDTGESLVAAQKLLDEERAKLAELEATASKSREAADAAKNSYETKLKAREEGDTTISDSDLEALKNQADTTENTAVDDRKRAEEAQANVAALEARRDAARVTAATGSAAGQTGEVVYQSTLDQHTADAISDAVVNIVALVFEDDEVARSCIKKLNELEDARDLNQFCQTYLNEKRKLDEALRLEFTGAVMSTEDVESMRGEYGSLLNTLFLANPARVQQLFSEWLAREGLSPTPISIFVNSASGEEKKSAYLYVSQRLQGA